MLAALVSMYPAEIVAATETNLEEPPERVLVVWEEPNYELTTPIIGKSEHDARRESKPRVQTPPVSRASGSREDVKVLAAPLIAEAFGEAQFGAFNTLVMKESGWNPNAQNPRSTAYGICQFLNGTWRGTGYQKTSDPETQIKACIVYIKNRYGTPSGALAFHRSHNWY